MIFTTRRARTNDSRPCRAFTKSRALRLAAGALLLALTGCQTVAQRECEDEGHEVDSQAFRDCVAQRRLESSMEMKQQAGGNFRR